jgi:histidinol-phosphatase
LRPAPADASFGPAWSAGFRRLPDETLAAWLELAQRLADEADAMAMDGFGSRLAIERKADGSLVSDVDRRIEAHLGQRIAAAYPDHGLVGEELGETLGQAPGAKARWYVDPIDGTHNYVRRIPVFATLLAVEAGGEVQVGLVSAPALGRRWFASRGAGAWLVEGTQGRRLAVSAIDELADAQLLYGSPRDVEPAAPGFSDLLARTWRDRGFGDFWGYALVAEGGAEGMIDVGVQAWDLAAPLVIVEEAGGRLTDLGGRRTIHAGSGVASNGRLHGPLVEGLAAPRRAGESRA